MRFYIYIEVCPTIDDKMAVNKYIISQILKIKVECIQFFPKKTSYTISCKLVNYVLQMVHSEMEFFKQIQIVDKKMAPMQCDTARCTTQQWEFLIVNAIWLFVQIYRHVNFVQNKYPESKQKQFH